VVYGPLGYTAKLRATGALELDDAPEPDDDPDDDPGDDPRAVLDDAARDPAPAPAVAEPLDAPVDEPADERLDELAEPGRTGTDGSVAVAVGKPAAVDPDAAGEPDVDAGADPVGTIACPAAISVNRPESATAVRSALPELVTSSNPLVVSTPAAARAAQPRTAAVLRMNTRFSSLRFVSTVQTRPVPVGHL
jgi:hypothetical protein